MILKQTKLSEMLNHVQYALITFKASMTDLIASVATALR